MKKTLIGAIVGGIILFIWQFLSWAAINLHEGSQKYTPNQDEILKFLGDNLEEGFYYLPTYPPGTSATEGQKLMEASMGKPWAQVYYHKAMDMNMGMNMGRSVLVDIIAVFLLIWVFLKMNNPSFQTILLSSIAVGFIGYLAGDYTKSIWFDTNTIMDLVDAIVSWGIIGAWLGWWLRRD